MLAVSLDGRLAPAEGGAAQLGGRGDRRRLEDALAWADAALVGAQTLRSHGTSCLIHAADLLRHRRQMGLPPQPPVLVWSRSGILPADLPFFRQPFERWLLMDAAQISSSTEVKGFGKIVPFDAWPPVLARLGALGLRRIAVLGGGRLAAALVAAGALDELQLTLCPTLLGGEHLWLPLNALGDRAIRWRLVERAQLEGGDQLLRYERRSGT